MINWLSGRSAFTHSLPIASSPSPESLTPSNSERLSFSKCSVSSWGFLFFECTWDSSVSNAIWNAKLSKVDLEKKSSFFLILFWKKFSRLSHCVRKHPNNVHLNNITKLFSSFDTTSWKINPSSATVSAVPAARARPHVGDDRRKARPAMSS